MYGNRCYSGPQKEKTPLLSPKICICQIFVVPLQSFSTKTDKTNTLRLSHYPYYIDRATEYELCRDFPTDEILIDGLHSMQCHLRNNNVAVDIPVVRVMNTVHYIASYMFSTECSGDQMEYDVLAYDSYGRDKNLVPLTMIVLAAMLLRTEGFRARQCRSVILENRDSDFEEGVTLYDRFLRSAEQRFSMEDFLTDIPALVEQNQQLQIENNRLTTEISQLKYTITTMDKQRPQTIVYNYGTYNDIHDNPNSTIYTVSPDTPTEEHTPATNTPSSIPPDFFCVSARYPEENIRERLTAELSQATSKKDYCRALYRLQHIGCINIDQYASDAQRAEVINRFQSKYTLSASDFCKARMS